MGTYDRLMKELQIMKAGRSDEVKNKVEHLISIYDRFTRSPKEIAGILLFLLPVKKHWGTEAL